MRSGETLGGGEKGERERDDEREIGAQVLRLPDEVASEDVPAEGDELERARRLNDAVFEKVDILAVIERTLKAAERIDLDKLVELREGLRENPEIGAMQAENYFAEVLNLSVKPWLKTDQALDKGTLGSCSSDGLGVDRISVDLAQHKGDMDSVLETLAHENWHSYQYDAVRRVKHGGDDAVLPDELVELAKLYEHNDKFYIKSDLDYMGYRKQLCEIEAETFGKLVKFRIEKIKAEEAERADFIAAHPEVYGDENWMGIEKEIDGVLHGLDVDDFLRKVGVQSLDDLWEADEDEQITERYARALSELVGLKRPLEVRFEDEFENGKRARVDYRQGRVTISRKKMWDFQPLARLPEVVWKMRQREMMRDDPDGERSRMYRLNSEIFIKDSFTMREVHKSQLLVREADYFREEFLNILDEQVTEEAIAAMSPEEREEVEKEKAETGWEPVTSQKYEIRRS